jgi:hypothetical protein
LKVSLVFTASLFAALLAALAACGFNVDRSLIPSEPSGPEMATCCACRADPPPDCLDPRDAAAEADAADGD